MRTKTYTIGALGRLTDTKVETIRYYERSGLLPAPPRTDGNYRLYDDIHLKRLSFIRRARDLGFTMEQIGTLMALADQRDQSCAAVDAIAREHLVMIEQKLRDLNALQAELSALIARCGCGTISECRIIDALSPALQRS